VSLWEITATVSYKIWRGLVGRVEYRHDQADEKVFKIRRPGLVLAIEPMVTMGTPEVEVQEDGWTAVTRDGSLSAHSEHTVAITEQGPAVLTRNNARPSPS